MIPLIREEKAIAIIVSDSPLGISILAYRIRGSSYRRMRLPGGGVLPGESHLEAAYREIVEECGLCQNDLVYMRKVGSLEYFKPITHKEVRRSDFLFFCREKLPDNFVREVSGDGKDKGHVFEFEFIPLSRISEIDEELTQYLNIYNLPELFSKSGIFGLEHGSIRLETDSSTWRRIYEFQEMEIRNAVSCPMDIQHIGSTSVPEFGAKPIVDMLIGVDNEFDFPKLGDGLEGIGYLAKGENGIEGRRYFVKQTSLKSYFHLHAFQKDSMDYSRHLAAREILIKSKEARQTYLEYKIRNMNTGRESYTEGKVDIFSVILAIQDK